MIKFNGENILVTGASDGLGKAICLLLNSLGANVIGIARSEDKLKSLKAEMEYKEKFSYIIRDLSIDIDELPSLVSKIAKEYGKLSGLVYAAGIIEILPLKAITEEKLNQIHGLNFNAGVMLCKGFSDKRNNVGDKSSIVLLSSIASLLGYKGLISYSTSKGAINSLVKSLAIELSQNKIRVNTVSPGHINTELFNQNKEFYSKEFLEELETKYPFGLGEPEDIANIVTFLLSDKSRWITGQNIVVDGGRTLL
ncbi:SDR family oxidoreductase [Aliarcobacter butzleri]|uniref:SDR family NAD(P)-dependent oxidoreductase n=1 Tax=Aliarcobacter butzleri TaxID=28197 RepID=UPI001EDA54B5|nr:SDR family oxidoreductase [Aliarcobacter butzleri]MCG3713222.1 SDR family oxidoreductase [Aliarcobacter butzleri]